MAEDGSGRRDTVDGLLEVAEGGAVWRKDKKRELKGR